MTHRFVLSLVFVFVFACGEASTAPDDAGLVRTTDDAPVGDAATLVPDGAPTPETDGGSSTDPDAFEPPPADAGPPEPGVTVRPLRSLLITDPGALQAVQSMEQGKLGIQLKRLGRTTIEEWATGGSRYAASELGAWVAHPFRAARDEFTAHNDSPFQERLGIRDDGNPYQHVLNRWGATELNGPNAMVQGGPFRLLAVVNRMDIAGDKDERGIIDAARQPRNFGEARLVYGLVDPAYERDRGRPYPMTFIIEYRLPALDAALQPSASYPAGMLTGTDLSAWRVQMQRWAQLWAQLSQWDPENPAEATAFRDHLKRIVRLFAVPENFTALRANVAIRRADAQPEFELREWYMVRNDQWTLIPRKPRDEPYRCLAAGGDLAALIGHSWDGTQGDLRMDRVNDDRGWMVPRAVNNAPNVSGYTFRDPPRGCNLGGGVLPFEMAPNDGGRASRLTAPFGRYRENFVWDVRNRAEAPIPEAQRHQFAMRTCTGCHSREAGLFGFHIAPRLAGERSRLSSFLTGGASFTNAGVTYRYAELAGRTTHLERAAIGDPTLEPYEALYRHDAAP